MPDYNFNPYLLVIINGFCTGLGIITAQWFYNKFIENKLNKMHGEIVKIKKATKSIMLPKK